MTKQPPKHLEYLILAAILGGYLLVAGLYALQTAPWQAPDEPAHYNYIAQIVAVGCCPVIEMGDWDQTYLDQLKSNKFDPTLTADLPTIQYEDHQPPLYYLLAGAAYRFTNGSLLAVRLFSVMLGAGVVLCAYALGRVMLPRRRGVALAGAALVAFIPQHVAILASVNNDALALLLVAATLLLCAVYLSQRGEAATYRRVKALFSTGLIVILFGGTLGAWNGWHTGVLILVGVALVLLVTLTGRAGQQASYHIMLGTLLGLAFVTKATAYFLVAVVALAVILRPIVIAAQTPIGKGAGVALKVAAALSKLDIPQTNATARNPPRRLGWRFGWGLLRNAREAYAPIFRRHTRRIVRGLVLVLSVGVAFGGLWWARNLMTYGFPDILGLVAHDAVVVGQLRTAEQIEQVGWAGYWQGAIQTTFNSFWGQLGWMALPLPANWYPIIGGMVAVAGAGLVVDIARARRQKLALPSARQVIIGVLLGLTGIAALAQYTYYNLTFYQVQGRYLFVALVPFALLIAAGFDGWRRLITDAVQYPFVARYAPYAVPLGVAVAFGAMNLWLLRFVVPVLAP